jgi:hypothetical protein
MVVRAAPSDALERSLSIVANATKHAADPHFPALKRQAKFIPTLRAEHPDNVLLSH